MNALLQDILDQTDFEEGIKKEILDLGRLKKSRLGDVVIDSSASTNEIPLLLQGLLKVMRIESSGKEVFLYYLEGGETCAMSITCCLEGTKANFKVVAEEDSLIWMIPMGHLDSWITKYRNFRRFIFRSYQNRFDELLGTIDSIVFSKLDDRIYQYLLDKKQASGSFVIEKTHEQIAKDLHTSRVVVSRLLKQLEKEEKIEQHRNRIEIL